MEETTVEEVAISYINGNISWVRHELNCVEFALSVALWLLENSPEHLPRFLKVYGMD